MKVNKELVANLCHEQWSGWMKYLFTKGALDYDGSFIIDKKSVERWLRQMNTPYNELSIDEQNSDKVEADKFIQLFKEMQSE